MDSTTFTSASGLDIPVELFVPDAAASTGRGVVVAYGTEGLNQPFGSLIDDEFCAVLADNGIVAARVDYFHSTNTAHGTASVMEALLQGASATWVATLVECARWLPSQPYGVGGNRIGFVGFSLGGNQVLRAGQSGVASAIVDFFAPVNILPGTALKQADVRNLPPVQIHHGKADDLPCVPYSQSDPLLKGWLTAAGRVVEMHAYPGQGHPGQLTDSWDATTHAQATTRAVAFLLDKL